MQGVIMAVPASGPELQRPVGSSLLAREMVQLRSGQRTSIGVTIEAIYLWDAIVTCAAMLTDETDTRSITEKLESLFSGFELERHLNAERLHGAAEYIGQFTSDDLPEWATMLKRDGPKRFLVRMLGAATYRRCALALQNDGAILTLALRRATRALMPYAVAFDDVLAVVPSTKLNKLSTLGVGPSAALALALQLDQMFEDRSRDWGFPLALLATRDDEVTALQVSDILSIAEGLREYVAKRSRDVVNELDSSLGRKFVGAREALQYSSDGVPQAASSLIELFDRVMRAAFADDEVISWMQRNYPTIRDVTYRKTGSGPDLATKKAQALCFAHGGQDVEQPSPLHQLAVEAVLATRDKLQKIKHSDTGAPEEEAALRTYLAAIEGFMTLVVGFVWAAVPEERIQQFKLRLEARV